MRSASKFRSRKDDPRRRRRFRPHVETLESRLPPGEVLLTAVLGPSLFEPALLRSELTAWGAESEPPLSARRAWSGPEQAAIQDAGRFLCILVPPNVSRYAHEEQSTARKDQPSSTLGKPGPAAHVEGTNTLSPEALFSVFGALPAAVARRSLNRYQGIFTNRSQTSLDQITDGTSNTLMFIEYAGGQEDGRPIWSFAWMSSATVGSRAGLRPRDSYVNGFSSAHQGIIQACFADGNVRALKTTSNSAWFYWLGDPMPPESSAWWVVQELAGMHDGGVRDKSGILP